MQEHHLEELLPFCWLTALRETIEASPKAVEILGVHREASIVPARRNIFKCLQRLPPLAVKVVIIADAPFPAADKATGIACFDGSPSWESNMSPTLRHTIKSALMSRNHCKRDDSVAAVRAALRRLQTEPPEQWFERSTNQGVLWLNASLSRTPDTTSVDVHAKFWKPIIGEIVRAIAREKAQLPRGSPNRALCIALWGSRAKGLDGLIRQRCQDMPLRVVTNRYPPNVQGFLDSDSFGDINRACEDLGMAPITWVHDTAYVEQLLRRRLRDDDAIEEDEVPARRRRRNDQGARMPASLLWPPCEEATGEQESCTICMVNKINTVILDCAHVAVCANCATMLQECPICRGHIHKVVRTYSAR